MDGKTTTLSAQGAATLPGGRAHVRFYFLAVFLALASSLLFLNDNDFSVQCHTDEPGKVEQILSRQRNLNHPLLMLNAAQAVFDASGLAPTSQNAVRVGRWVIGGFAVLTVLAFAAAAEVTAGPLAALVCGVFLMVSPLLVEISHYFKEDPAMSLGLGVALLGIALFQKAPAAGNVVLMAVGAALAAAGKHAGIAVIPFCLYAIARQGAGRGRRIVGFCAVLLAVYALIDYQAVTHLFQFERRMDCELDLIKQGGLVPANNGAPKKYIGILMGNFPWPLFWFVGFGAWVWVKQKKPTFGIAALFAVAFFVAICSINKTAGRYFLPVGCMACYLAGVGAAWLAERPGWKWRAFGVWVPLLVATGLALPRAWDTVRAFQNDTRLKMTQWINANLPAEAVIAQDEFGHFEAVRNSDSPYRLGTLLVDKGMNISSVPLAELKAAGVGYVLLVNPEAASSKKKKYQKAGWFAGDSGGLDLAQCQKLREYKGSKRVTNVSPDVILYRLPTE